MQANYGNNPGPDPNRFQLFQMDALGKGFYLPSGEYFQFDQFGGWFDEFGYYYDQNGTPCQPPYQPTASQQYGNNQQN